MEGTCQFNLVKILVENQMVGSAIRASCSATRSCPSGE